ncbi:hypothetical protein GIB67_008607 [Kingdonia uniflora]|uniref:PTC1-like winged helix-turn-helix domain-containing protein n=1 Tax=Kingdonia uniflora TaxID=39325 RepID=A0A7J7M4V3_9MAGN|nr:hypothetical protein GIB67_008607 [Kingdonia uniflora]
MYPELYEEFVVRSNQANHILVRQVPTPEFNEHRNLHSFWVLPNKISDSGAMGELKIDEADKSSSSTHLLSPLSSVLPSWGVRRRVAFVSPTDVKPLGVIPSSSSIIKDEEDAVNRKKFDLNVEPKEEVAVKRKKLDLNSELQEEAVKRNKLDLNDELQDYYDPNMRLTRNRKLLLTSNRSKITSKKSVKLVKEKKQQKQSNRQNLKLSYDRWSRERYKTAEVRMYEIMKEKGAKYDKPVLRQALRNEARKHIGDTGLLDHLLKHMSGKATPNGEDRFRRRHNADGVMEYWLESADLVDVRKEAGVKDPYWTPPPGWEIGDSPTQDPSYAKEMKLLKEEMVNIKR